jgi:hypothetical protein
MHRDNQDLALPPHLKRHPRFGCVMPQVYQNSLDMDVWLDVHASLVRKTNPSICGMEDDNHRCNPPPTPWIAFSWRFTSSALRPCQSNSALPNDLTNRATSRIVRGASRLSRGLLGSRDNTVNSSPSSFLNLSLAYFSGFGSTAPRTQARLGQITGVSFERNRRSCLCRIGKRSPSSERKCSSKGRIRFHE